MARYALIDPNGLIHVERDEKKIIFSDPVGDGYDWRIIVNQTNDLTTPGNVDTKTLPVVEAIEPTRVLRTRTVVDQTAQEVAAQVDAVVDAWDTARRDEMYALAIYCKDLTGLVFNLVNTVRANNGDAAITLAQFSTQMDAAKSAIPLSAFKSRVKGNLS